MQPEIAAGDSLLDIGGGVGAIGLELQGLQEYTGVDASTAYQKEAQQLFKEHQWKEENLRFINGDFVEEAPQITKHQHVSLDKVICCYPEMEALLTAAAGHAEKQLGMVYPSTGWIASLFKFFANSYFRIKKSAFRSYLHKPEDVGQVLTDSGFELRDKTISFPWRVEVWYRV